MKIGLLGGTFDPIHNGHLTIANLALRTFKLDKVLFIPNGKPPHKSISSASKAEKSHMIKLAIKGNDQFEIENFELENEGVSYLYKTLQFLHNKYKDAEFYFLAGADNIVQISTWKKPNIIFDLATIVFFKRPGFITDNSVIKTLIDLYNGKIKVIDFKGNNVSSSEIRKKIAEFESVKGLLPDFVFHYIIENGIYLKELKEKLKGHLNENRYNHSLCVAKEAARLAVYNHLDEEKAYLCGLLHDCAKNMDFNEQIELITKYNTFELMEDELSFPKVVHAVTGAIVAKREFNITDPEILKAIRFHTLGNLQMSDFDKIIYIADLISSDRNYKGIEIIRELAYNNIDKAILFSIENTLSYLKGNRIQADVLKLRDDLKEKIE